MMKTLEERREEREREREEREKKREKEKERILTWEKQETKLIPCFSSACFSVFLRNWVFADFETLCGINII